MMNSPFKDITPDILNNKNKMDDFVKNLNDFQEKKLEKYRKVAHYGYDSDSFDKDDDARIKGVDLDKELDIVSSGPEMIKAVLIRVSKLQSKFNEFYEPLGDLVSKINYLKSQSGEYHNNEKIASQMDELVEFVKDFEASMETFSVQFRGQRNAFEELEREEIKHHAGEKEKNLEF